MSYSDAIDFTRKYLECYHIPMSIYNMHTQDYSTLDSGLRKGLFKDYDYNSVYSFLSGRVRDKVLYRVKDYFECCYYLIKLPDKENEFVSVGPYRLSDEDFSINSAILSRLELPPGKNSVLEKIFKNIGHFEDDRHIHNLMLTLSNVIWGGIDSFEFKEQDDLLDEHSSYQTTKLALNESEDTMLSMRLLEERYDTERLIMDAIAHGQAHKAEMYLSNMSVLQMDKRSADPVRNMKNYSVIMNTLFRKAVEQGGVHPLHIDSISSKFARKIESCHSVSALGKLQKEMIGKYCSLVKNNSLKGYSQLVRKVITHIESDLSADLSLHHQAELLNINPSYLSTLFKKETGQTLTEFVNRKRVEHAVYLLNSTNMQVQVIAQQCGIPDVNYFSKTFKKFTGKSPKEARESAHR